MEIKNKRITLLCGHYGSGKTGIAVALALHLKKHAEKVTIADLDIVNPYFRTKDSRDLLEANGIRLIASEYAGTNVDIPALPSEAYSLTDDRSSLAVIDVGGDDRGALALGRIAPKIIEENNFDMWLVINRCRPLTRDAESVIEIKNEIEYAGGIAFTGIVNNTNLGAETDAETVLSSVEWANEVSRLSGLPVVMTTVCERLFPELSGKIDNLFPIKPNMIE